jgi:predicted protein tyrosine phosphatase
MDDSDSPETNQINIDIAGGITGNSGTTNVAARDIIQANNSTIVVGTAAEAVQGLMVLRELMQRSSDVKSAVIAFQTDFKVVHEQVDRIADYKDLHDSLHHLQVHCYNGVAQAVSRFPADQLTVDTLTDHSLTLDEIVETLSQIANRPSVSKHELGWIDDIGIARADLATAIDALDEKLLKRVIWRLRRVLGTQPARINLLLNHSVRAFRLPALLSALGTVCQTLDSLNIDSDKIHAFQSGVDALKHLEKELGLLVEDHDHWQELDVELHLIERLIENDLTEFEMSWSDIRVRSESLYEKCTDEWANTLRKECLALEEALKNSNVTRARRSFYNYHRHVTYRFYRIDVQLKALCDDLRKIGSPLNSVLDIIQ